MRRGVFQAGVLTERELNELESFLTVHRGQGQGILLLPHPHRQRRHQRLGRPPLPFLHADLAPRADYVSTTAGWTRDPPGTSGLLRCRSPRRRAYIPSFRDNGDDSCLGEDTLLQFYVLLHQGMMDNVRQRQPTSQRRAT